MRRAALLTLLFSTACPKDAAVPENLASEARRNLAERDKRLARYLVEATSKQGEASASYTFAYRAPGKVKGSMLGATPLTLAFDGTRFFKLDPGAKKLEAFEMKLPAEKAALFLTTQFSPFVPEGYRTPLLPLKGVTARKVAHPKGPEAYELSHSTPDENGRAVTVTYLLRFPSADFLSKKTEANGVVNELSVEAEHCDSALLLCVPKVVVQREGGQELGRTTFTRIELTPELPADTFTLTAPEGFTTEKHELVESKEPG